MSDTFECPSCALDVTGKRADYEACPFCGYEFPIQRGGFKLVAVLLVLLMVFFALYLL